MKNLIIAFLLTIAGCAQKNSTAKPLMTPNEVTLEGFNFIQTPRKCEKVYQYFNEENLLQICNDQTYEFDLLRKKERRLSYQDGKIFDAAKLADQKYLYSSNTDQIKTSFLNSQKNLSADLSDIFLSHLNEFNIEKLSLNQANNRLIQANPLENKIAFVQQDNKGSKIFASHPTLQGKLEIYQTPNSIIDFIYLNQNNGFLWVEEAPNEIILKSRVANKVSVERTFDKSEFKVQLGKSTDGEVLGILTTSSQSEKGSLLIRAPGTSCEHTVPVESAKVSSFALSTGHPFLVWILHDGSLLNKSLTEADSPCLLDRKSRK